MAKFTHLHVHSHYSLLDGLPKIGQLVDRAKELGMDSIALTDHGNLYGAVEFLKDAKKKGVKPIIGAEIYLAFEGMEQKRPKIDDTIYHLVVLVKNQKGYENLVSILTQGHLRGFYYKPRVDEDFLREHAEGLIALSGCLNGKIPRLLQSKKKKEAEATALFYQEIFGKDNFYFELQRHANIPAQKTTNQGLLELSEKLKIPVVATADSHYLSPEDSEAQDVLMLINTGARPDDPDRLTLSQDDFSLKSAEDMEKLFSDIPEAIANTQRIAKLCNFELELGVTKLPIFPLPEGKNADDYLQELCLKGLQERPNIQDNKETASRLEFELSVIRQTGFASYFLIVQDFVNWAKSKRIVVGPGRGSVGGSLVAYLLKITNINPLQYNLLFERFLNPERLDLPDIDLDFADYRRDEVISYVADKYGSDKVAQIITFGTMAARAVIRDVGRALGYEYGYCDKMAKMIPFSFNLQQTLEEVEEFKELYDTDEKAKRLIDLAKKLEGVARHASTHACGVVIAAQPLNSLVPLQHPTQNDQNIVTQYGMHSIEDLGLLKMDFLGLKNLSVIEDTLKRIYVIHHKSIDIEAIPQDDPKAYKLFQEGNTVGIFQVECLAGDTIVSNTTIKKLYEKQNKKTLEAVYIDEGKVHKTPIKGIHKSGKKQMYTLIAENGWYVKASKDHQFLTTDGWKKLSEIIPGEQLLMKQRAKHATYHECLTCAVQLNGSNGLGNKYCYRCSASFYKNPSKPFSRQQIQKGVLATFQAGRQTWNKEKSKQNSDILLENGRKISKALTGKTWIDMYGYQKAQLQRTRFSERMKGEKNHMFGKRSPHRKGGYRVDLGHYVRSNWEADFARVLKYQGLEYQYEPQTFQLTRDNGDILHYTPDFYVPSQNTYYEIKGWMHDLDQEKINLFQEQYPQYSFVLISATKFAEFALRYKELVAWECPRIPIERSFDFVRVREIKKANIEETYDIAMEEPGNNFVASGFIVHNSGGMQRYLKQLKPTEFEDIIAMIALYRPGPMELIPEYIARKHGKKKITYIHEKLKPILEATQGICIYQEQLMRIAQDLAGFTLAEADVLRKAVGKKIKSLLEEQKEKFISGMVKNNIERKVANQLWEWVLPFARYGFNKSHSAAYATIAYQTAWLKTHYPVEFMSALLTAERNDIERIAFLIDETKKMKIEVLPPDINESFSNFSVVPDKNQIRFGLLAIKNVGEGIVEAIIEERKKSGPYKSMQDFISRISSSNLNKKSLESLIKSGAFDAFAERNKLLFNLERLLQVARESFKMKNGAQQSLFSSTPQASVELPLEEADEVSENLKLQWEKELLGLYVSSHPLASVKNLLEKKAFSIAKITGQDSQSGSSTPQIRIGGIISSIKRIITKAGKPMLFLGLEDLTDKIEVVVFPSLIDKYPDIVQENKIVLVIGRLNTYHGTQKFIAEEIEELVAA